MLGRFRGHDSDGRLDRLGREVVRAGAAHTAEAEAAAASPFLYAKVRARIAEERRRREEAVGPLAALAVAWRAVPALALVAVLALFLFLSAAPGPLGGGGFVEEAFTGGAQAGGYEQVVFAERDDALTGDDVLATIIDDGREAMR